MRENNLSVLLTQRYSLIKTLCSSLSKKKKTQTVISLHTEVLILQQNKVLGITTFIQTFM